MLKKYLLLILSFNFILLSTTIAQTGILSGTIKEAGSNTTLPGATVYVEGTPLGVVSDINGAYTITSIPVGTQTITFSFLGFDDVKETVEIKEGEATELNVELGIAAITSETVVVTGQLLGQQKAINQQLNSESIANIVSADKIQELPDVNAAEAIARLPGISLNRSGGEGQKVIVRGLEPKFSAITVNGVRLPGNAGTDRSVDLSLISPELLDGIEVYKSPLPDMDAESIGGTINLRLRKAPKETRFMVRGLGGYNWQNRMFGDYKGVVQFSKRVLNDKLGVLVQGNTERFNRGGDFLNYSYSQGGTDSTGLTRIFGNSASYTDAREWRKRNNTSFNLDYDAGAHTFALFGLYSRQSRDRFDITNSYNPNAPGISYVSRGRENNLNLYNVSLTGDHKLSKLTIDWNLSVNKSEGRTPYDFEMIFSDNQKPFDSEINLDGSPAFYKDFANPDLATAFLVRNDATFSSTDERNITGMVNLKVPIKLTDKIGGYLKFGGKYIDIERSRDVNSFEERFYYLGAETSRTAQEQWGDGLIYSEINSQLISINNFLADDNDIRFNSDESGDVDFEAKLDEDVTRQWYDAQLDVLNNNREVAVQRYSVQESIAAGYVMMKLNFGKALSVIPGFRYERSDNTYSGKYSNANGRYGVNGFISDSTTFQEYGEFLPHLHIKFKPLEWFDVRASYATTLARPDFNFLTPWADIDDTGGRISAGNPNLQYTKSRNVDLFFSAYKRRLGLLTFGVFYKDIENLFIPWQIQLANAEIAEANGFGNKIGYLLRSYTNLPETQVYGLEVDLQTNLSFLPAPFNGIVLNANYAKLYSTTEVFFLTSETIFQGFPPVPVTTFTSNEREVSMPSQSPDIFNLSIGYDYKGFSARVSGNFQGTKATSYNLNKDFDRYTLEFWRWDMSIKQKINKNWSAFFNLNNFGNQQDVTFTRNENFINNVSSYGMTGTAGVQFRL